MTLEELRTKWSTERARYHDENAHVRAVSLVDRFLSEIDQVDQVPTVHRSKRQLLTVKDVQRELSLSAYTVTTWCREGRFRGAKKIGSTWRIPAEDLETVTDTPLETMRF